MREVMFEHVRVVFLTVQMPLQGRLMGYRDQAHGAHVRPSLQSGGSAMTSLPSVWGAGEVQAGVDGAVHVPLYMQESWDGLDKVIKHSTAIGMGGWWLGGVHMIPNTSFMAEVQARIPKDAKIIVACQKGLRSLQAAEMLSRAGYSTLAWVNGGLDTAKKEDLPVVGADDLRYGGIGGLSELLGWTDVQREKSSGFLGGGQNVIYMAVAVLVADGLWVAYDQVQLLLK
eukprot:jgi/Botrbrau1/19206/Bobra.0077s0108.2